ncbi:MAG: archease [Nanoarchaeota archaeon]
MEKPTPKYEFLEHTADIKIKLYGITLQEIFENSVLAVADYMSEGKKISPNKVKIIDVKGDDVNSLLYNFIEDILYLVDAEGFIPAKASITMRGNNLHAELYGDDTKKYTLKHIKSPTYAEMIVKNDSKKKWIAQLVLDV